MIPSIFVRATGMLLLTLLGTAVHGVARADMIAIEGTTFGAFNGDAPAVVASIGHSNGSGASTYLIYTASDFGGLSDEDGSLLLTLGSFGLTLPAGNPAITFSDNFSIELLFSAPAGITGASANPLLAHASVAGTVNKNNGSVVVDFADTPIPVTFANLSSSGLFNLIVNDVVLNIHSPANSISAPLTASIANAQVFSTSSAVPEPASMTLFGIAMVAIGLVGRKKLLSGLRQ